MLVIFRDDTESLERWNKITLLEKLLKVPTVFEVTFQSQYRRYIMYTKYFNGERTENNKEALKEVTKYFENYLKEEHQIEPGDVLLYSLSIDGTLLITLPEYEELVIKEKFNVFDEKNKGVCAITNKDDVITGDTTRFKFNYYINDKINFASNLEKSNYKDMAIGKNIKHS